MSKMEVIIGKLELDACQVAIIEQCIAFARSHRGDFQSWLGHSVSLDDITDVRVIFQDVVKLTKKMRWDFKPGAVVGSDVVILGEDDCDEELPEATIVAKAS